MGDLVEEIRHEGTLPGKTLRRRCTVTSSYLLHSSSFTFWDSDVKLKGPVTLMDGRFGAVGLALKVADAAAVSIHVENHTVTMMNHFPH